MNWTQLQLISSIAVLPFLIFVYFRLRLKRLGVYHSPILGKIEVFEKYNKEKVLTINSFPEGVSTEDQSIKKSYFYKIAQETLDFCQNIKQPKILMLGLGANTISKLINQQNPQVHQTIIEIDSQIIQAAHDFFDLEKLTNYTLIQANAYKLIEDKSALKSKFDVIIVDIFIGTPTMVPHQSNQPHFIQKLSRKLTKNGIMIFNRPGNTELAKQGTYKLRDYLQKIFKKVDLFFIEDPRRYKNYVIVGRSHLD